MRACVLALAVSVCALPDVGGPRKTENDKGALERRASGEADRADEERRLADCSGYGTVLLSRHECPRSLNFPDVPVGFNSDNCEDASCGEICEGDGVCDTSQGHDNCFIADDDDWDVYRKICDSPLDETSPSSTAPPFSIGPFIKDSDGGGDY